MSSSSGLAGVNQLNQKDQMELKKETPVHVRKELVEHNEQKITNEESYVRHFFKANPFSLSNEN